MDDKKLCFRLHLNHLYLNAILIDILYTIFIR